jgi:hypothetical protein
VNIAGEDFRLKHIDRTKDQPAVTKGLLEILANMKEKKDWNNLAILLEGLKIAGRKVQPPYMEKLVRKAGMARRQDTIIECARRVSRTGFELRDVQLVRQLFWWIQHKALSRKWDTPSIKKALTQAEQTAALLEDKRHSGGVIRGKSDPRIRPEVIGILLQLAAANAKLPDTKDNSKVEIYAHRLLGSLARGIDLREDLSGTEGWHARNELLCYVSPIIHGMRGAIQVLGPNSEIAAQLKKHEDELSTMAATERQLIGTEIPEGASSLGIWCYDKLLGSEAV